MNLKKMRCYRGYTFVEIMLILATVGVFAAITIPSVIYRADNSNALMQTKTIAAEIYKAATVFQANNLDVNPASMNDLALLTKYTSINTTTDLITDTTVSCSGSTPCYRFPDGGVLVPLLVTGSFHYDPDGNTNGLNDLPGVELRLFYSSSRIRVTTRESVTGVAGNDPAYVQDWTQLP